MSPWIRSLLVLAGLVLAHASHAAPDRRVALVIGNATYKAIPALPNPRNDADDVAAALRDIGFEVIEGRDLDRRGMGEALGRFARTADGADAALFYYAGHGLQFRGENFLVPVDGAPADEFAIPYETTRVADVLDALAHAKGVRLLILDACRNNPLADQIARSSRTRDIGLSRGLARINQSQGMVIAYATQANDVAADGDGRNSPFSAAFVEQLKEPGLEVGQVFRRVAYGVNQRTGGRQTPELSLSLLGDFYFNRSETDVQVWTKVRDGGDVAALRAFLGRFPNSYLADAAKARIDVVERSQREEALRRQLAGVEEERRRAADIAEAAKRLDAARQTREEAERERLSTTQAEARRKAEDEAARQQAEQQRRLTERLAQLEVENRKAQAELAARADEQARRARDDRERQQQAAERDRLSAAQADKLRTAEADAARQKAEEERRIAARLAKLEDDNRRAAAELAARLKAEEAMRQTAETERARLAAELEGERRRAAEELQRVQQEKVEAVAREEATPGVAPVAPVQVASLPDPTQAMPTAPQPDGAALTRSITRELERIGCFHGKPEASWSSGATSRAAREFARLASVTVPELPTTEFLEQLKGRTGRVCPLVCSPRQVVRGGACVAKTCPRGERLDGDGDCVAPAPKSAPRRVVQQAEPVVRAKPRAAAPAPTRSTPAAGRGGRCFNFNGQSFCE